MKKTIIASVMALATLAAGAKTADELRVYINPGHGSWTPNDRPCTLVGHGAYSRTNTDTLGFFESNTNLQKGFAVMNRLISYGLKFDRTLNQTGERWQIGAARDMSNNIVMSHVKCGPYHDDNGTENQLGDATPADIYYYNRNLSEICAEVEANNFDMFISIHSNAATEGSTANYPLFIYRGYDDLHEDAGVTAAHQNTSKDMADKCWAYAFSNEHMNWSYYSLTNKNLRGDINFYGSSSTSSLGYKGYLGALKHGTPGFLVEGYFHTYQPARHRAMNWDVDKVEGTDYAHGIADYFGLKKEKTGMIYGIVRDLDTKFKDKAYTPDPTSPDAYLPLNGIKVTLKKDGKEVATYTTDNYYNGAFVFEVEPGKYTLEFNGAEYTKYTEPVEVEVKEAAVAYPAVSIRNDNWVAPTIVYENYPDPVATNKGILAADEYKFETSYADEPVEALAGKTVRRVIARDGKLYILAESKDAKPVPTVVVYDAKEKAVLAQVSTNGAKGTVRDIADIQLTADGVLVACSENLNHFDDNQVAAGETRGSVNVYRWANDEAGLPQGDPAVWFSSKLSGNFYRANAGHSMAYSGTTADGQLIMSAVNASNVTTHKIFYNIFAIVDGEMVNAGIINQSNNNAEDLGEFTYTTAPDDSDSFIISSEKLPAYKVGFNNVLGTTSVADVAAPAPAVGFYRYAGHSFMVSPAADRVALTDLKALTDATAVTVDGTAIAATENVATAGEPEVDVDASTEAVTAAYMNLYAVSDGKVSKFTTRGAAQASHKAEYAYALKGETADDKYNVSFSLTGDVRDAELVFTPADGNSEPVVIPLGALKAGANTASVDLGNLDSNVEYSWAVRTTSATVATSGEYFADNNGLSVRGSVIPFTDPEYDSFGYILTGHGKNAGIDVYDPALTKTQDRIFKNNTALGGVTTNKSNPIRGDELRGEAVLATWGDTGYGAVRINPLDPAQEPATLFAGTKENSGNFVYEGVSLGGGTSGICFVGEGDDTRMYSFSEDHPASISATNNIVRYELGSGWQITKAPVNVGFGGTLANTNVDLISYGNGFFASQVRGAGNNAVGTPGFIYVDASDNSLQYSSGVLNDAETQTVPLTGCNSAVAITKDGKTLACADGAGSSIFVYDVAWDGSKPTLTYRYRFPIGASVWATARFDYAGNLMLYSHDKGGLHCYALAQETPVVTVPAKAAMTVKGTGSGVDNIVADQESNEPKVYYNLNGVRMPDNTTLAPGVYIVRQGRTVKKIAVN